MNNSTNLSNLGNVMALVSPYTAAEVVCIVLVAGSLSLATIIGNILVMVSIKVNRHLQTVNNYFLFSLACADLIIGVLPMNLYTFYIVIGYWPFGPVLCDLSVPDGECHIQFLSCPLTCGTAIAAFYLPIIIMGIFYWQISRASKSRMTKDKKEGGQNQDPVAPSLVQGKIVKPNNNNIPANEDGIDHSKIKKGKATGESVAGNCATAEEKESSNDSTSVSVVASNVKEDEAIKEDTRASVSQANAKGEHSKWTRIKVLTTSPKADCTDTTNTTVEIVGTDGPNGDEKQNVVARKIVKMAKQPAKKDTPPSREKKVTRTILGILLAFIITCTPYDVMALIHSFCASCIPKTAWTIGYWLCYINSMINPACYALCNATFKKTFKHLLLCNYKNTGATR
uniref:G-protein coupled receptors family 1 profile domain-containing protein n=1 Tax=Varanus komodoensis TaxID=61221 RepID=A0A8D2Q7B2_VARKO